MVIDLLAHRFRRISVIFSLYPAAFRFGVKSLLMDTSCGRMHKRKGLYLILIVLKRERSARIVRRLSESMSKAALIKSEPEQVVN